MEEVWHAASDWATTNPLGSRIADQQIATKHDALATPG